MHDKFCVIDNTLTITGSYNWTYSAEKRNSENIIITDNSVVSNSFSEHFSESWSCYEPLKIYTHKYIPDIKENDFIRDYDNFADEISCMIAENIIDSSANSVIENARNNIAVTRLATLRKVDHRKRPKLKQTIGMRCRIDGKDNGSADFPGWHVPKSRIKGCESVHKKLDVSYASELCSERLDLGVE